jgi:RNA polymerase sigma factor (sigma-70 family)
MVKQFGFITRNNAATCSTSDLEQEAWLAFLKAKKGFDVNRGVKFITYAYVYIQRELLKFIKKQTKLTTSSSLDDHCFIVQDDGEEKLSNVDMLDHLKGMLTEQENLILQEKFAGKTYKDISSLTGIAPVKLSKDIDKMIGKMKRAANRELKSYEDD